MTPTTESRRRMAAATEQAQVFLMPACQAKHERTDALLTAAELVRQGIEHAVCGGRDDLAHRMLALAQDIEAEAPKC